MYNITSKDFEYVDEENDSTHIRILTGPYTGVQYRYGSVSAEIIEEDELGKLKFSYEIIEGDDTLEDDQDFITYIGQTLEFVIAEAFESGNYKIGSKDVDTRSPNNGIEESA